MTLLIIICYLFSIIGLLAWNIANWDRYHDQVPYIATAITLFYLLILIGANL